MSLFVVAILASLLNPAIIRSQDKSPRKFELEAELASFLEAHP